MTPAWALRLLRWSYCGFIAWVSALTFSMESHDLHARILAGVELAAIAAFLLPALEVGAAAVLLVVYVAAAGITLMQGEPPWRFVFYVATTLYIVWTSKHAAGPKTGLAQA